MMWHSFQRLTAVNVKGLADTAFVVEMEIKQIMRLVIQEVDV